MISAVGVTKKFGDNIAVENLNLEVKSGEIFGFLGPNGAGKTTTISMLIGMLVPTSGRIEIDGIDVVKDPTRAKALIGYVPDQPNMYEKLTAMEFLMFVSSLYGIEPDKARKKANNLLEMFGLTDRANELLGGFSHGMKQKVVMSSALVHDPKVVFMDEPTVGLDPRSAKMVKDILKGLADHGVTVFLTTHILEIAERMCDRVGIIQKGRLLAVGTMEELRHQTEIQTGDSNTEAKSLEDLFLELTGGSEYDEVSRFLED